MVAAQVEPAQTLAASGQKKKVSKMNSDLTQGLRISMHLAWLFFWLLSTGLLHTATELLCLLPKMPILIGRRYIIFYSV